MKKNITLLLMMGMTIYLTGQGISLDCPSNAVCSHVIPVTGMNDFPVYKASEGDSAINAVADTYTASAAFNAIRFWGAWALGRWWNGCDQSSTEIFRIDIYTSDPVTGASPAYSGEFTGHLRQINGPDNYAPNFTGLPFCWHYPLYQVDIDFASDINILNGWISIRNLRDGTPCIFGMACSVPGSGGNGFDVGHFDKLSGGGLSGSWNPVVYASDLQFCLAHNSVNYTWPGEKVFNQAFDHWDGVSDAWEDDSAGSASIDDFTASQSFNHLTCWGGWVLGDFDDPSCIPGATESFQVDLFTNDPASGYSPDQTLVLDGTLTSTGFTFHDWGEQPIYQVDMVFNPGIYISNGWIQIRNMNTSGRTCEFGWLSNNDPGNGTYLDGDLNVQNGGLFFILGNSCTGGFADAGPDHTVYIGYPPMESTLLDGSGGTWYEWTPLTGLLPFDLVEPNTLQYNNYSATPLVEPSEAITYTLNATDENGCESTDAVNVNVEDVRCGNNMDKVIMCRSTNHGYDQVCVNQNTVQNHLDLGYQLGACPESLTASLPHGNGDIPALYLYPNPATDYLNIQMQSLTSGEVYLQVLDMTGNVVDIVNRKNLTGIFFDQIDLPDYTDGTYFIKAVNGERVIVEKFVVLH